MAEHGVEDEERRAGSFTHSLRRVPTGENVLSDPIEKDGVDVWRCCQDRALQVFMKLQERGDGDSTKTAVEFEVELLAMEEFHPLEEVRAHIS